MSVFLNSFSSGPKDMATACSSWSTISSWRWLLTLTLQLEVGELLARARSARRWRRRGRRRLRRARPRRCAACRRRSALPWLVSERADLVHLREQPVVGRGDRVALADRVLQPLAHQVERGRELAALLDRLQDRGLLPADLLHRDLEAVLRRARLGGALVALGGELVEPGLHRVAHHHAARDAGLEPHVVDDHAGRGQGQPGQRVPGRPRWRRAGRPGSNAGIAWSLPIG